MKNLYWLVLVIFLGACATYSKLDEIYGESDPTHFDRSEVVANADAAVTYLDDVKPILDNRCVVCHGCYDSPCQLNLSAYEGVIRGAHKKKVYNSSRLFAAEPTRLFMDAHENADWRKRDFFPVLNEREQTPENNKQASVMHRLLDLKRADKYMDGDPLPDDRYTFSLERSHSCPKLNQLDKYEQDHPEWGMPYALPEISEKEYQTLSAWIQVGAPYGTAIKMSDEHVSGVDTWEAFLNGDDLKSQLVARYIYEHWFLANLYFEDLPLGEYFKIVRSRTPPGQPIQVIPTLRPYDDPGVERVYYRFHRIKTTVLVKTHMPYALNDKRLKKLKEWFIDYDYEVTKLPDYSAKMSANPFLVFDELPIRSRYRFMLDEAQFTIMGYIKGPVCRGSVAVNVINDHFWVFFVNPDIVQMDGGSEFIMHQAKNLELPASKGSNASVLDWFRYSRLETAYLRGKSQYINAAYGADNPPGLWTIWDGDGENPNAALTVFRHFDNASVVKGLVGKLPETAWVIDYPLLERMHYLLVAGFDVYGNLGHQLNTRLFMDFLRMEGEFNFLSYLPSDKRDEVRDAWYRDAPGRVSEYLNGCKAFYSHETGIEFKTEDPFREMLSLLRSQLAPVLNNDYELTASGLPESVLSDLQELNSLSGYGVSFLPEYTVLTVEDDAGEKYFFSLARTSVHTNIAQLFGEDKRRRPNEDRLVVTHGFLGAYPNAFYSVKVDEIMPMVEAIKNIASAEDYTRLVDRFGIRRSDSRFWANSDDVHAGYKERFPIESGLLDLNRLENR